MWKKYLQIQGEHSVNAFRPGRTKLALLLALAIGFSAGAAHAGNKYVRPGATGNNSGVDWVNAYTSLPSSLNRGDTYYLADGTYGSYAFDDASSGNTLISIIKATDSNHGTDTGWTSAYGDGQAQFTSWSVSGDYYLFDGQVRNADWKAGAVSKYGIRVKNNGIALRLDNAGSNFGDNLIFRYIDFQAGGRDTGRRDDVIYSNGHTGSGIGPRNVTFSRCAMHDSNRTIFLMRQWNNLLVEYSYLGRNASSPEIHGEIVSDDGSDNVTFRFNVIEDPEGTAVIAILNGSGGAKSARNTASNWQLYGNVIFHSAGYNREGVSAVFYVSNNSSNNNYADNWRVYNNTVYNIKGLKSGVVLLAGSGNIVKNNLWHSSIRTGSTGASFDYNWYYNTRIDGDSGGNTVECTSNCSVFVDAVGKDFRINYPTAPGQTLGAPYNVDMNGAVRGSDGIWDRGAFEFGGVQQSVIPAPESLRVIE